MTVQAEVEDPGAACLARGAVREARPLFEAAYGEAERAGDAEGMARAALGLGGIWVHEHRTAVAAMTVGMRQRAALDRLDPSSPLALRLRVRLAAERDYVLGRPTAVLGLLNEARRRDDPYALAEALSLAHNCVLGPDHQALRVELARELIGVATRTGRRSDLLLGLLWYTADLFLGGTATAERRLSELRDELATGDHLMVSYVADAMGVMLAIRAGRLAEAESLAAACASLGAAAGSADAPGWHGLHLATLRWYQGRLPELLPLLSELATSASLSAVDHASTAGLALAAATAGDRRAASYALERVRGRDLGDLPRSSSWLLSMYATVEAARLLGDVDVSARAYRLLKPYEHLPVVTSLGVACFGSVHHSLGTARLTLGDLDGAIGHLQAALRSNLAYGHLPAATLSRHRLAQALALRDGPRDATARRELALAESEAAELGMTLPADTPRTAAPPSLVTCLARGRNWQLRFRERSALVVDSVGMRHLHTLLSNPGQEIKAADLAGGSAVAESAQPLLDESAKRQYRERLAALGEHDHEERAWLLAELAAAAGFGGRSRTFADSGERARVAVGKAVRRAIQRITTADATIGAELRATIRTGMWCSYTPH